MRHVDPPIFTIDNFLSSLECDYLSSLINNENDNSNNIYVVDDDARVLVERMSSPTFSSSHTTTTLSSISRRTSTTWFCRYTAVPTFLAKVKYLLPPSSVTIKQMEEPQIVRYEVGQEFTFHYDTIPSHICNTNGGQRIATIIVYLNDVTLGCGGGTIFRDLYMDNQSQHQQDQQQQRQLTISPKKGTAVLFYPAYSNTGKSDLRTLHGGEIVTNGGEKRIIQLWIHERDYVASIPYNNCQADAIDLVDAESKRLGFF
jgi:prolyl 4-hydroxylase